jgi:hypothetical protein
MPNSNFTIDSLLAGRKQKLARRASDRADSHFVNQRIGVQRDPILVKSAPDGPRPIAAEQGPGDALFALKFVVRRALFAQIELQRFSVAGRAM